MICVDAGSAHLCMEAIDGLRIARQTAKEITAARLNQHSLTHITGEMHHCTERGVLMLLQRFLNSSAK
jgi:hypothetical protein